MTFLLILSRFAILCFANRVPLTEQLTLTSPYRNVLKGHLDVTNEPNIWQWPHCDFNWKTFHSVPFHSNVIELYCSRWLWRRSSFMMLTRSSNSPALGRQTETCSIGKVQSTYGLSPRLGMVVAHEIDYRFPSRTNEWEYYARFSAIHTVIIIAFRKPHSRETQEKK